MKLYVVDSSLCREGAKALSFREKLQLAKNLDKSGVDAILLNAPLSGKEELVVSRTIAGNIGCGAMLLCDSASAIEAAQEALKDAKRPCIAIRLPVSTVQMEYMYHKKAPQMLEVIAGLCAQASGICENVIFIAADASRAEEGFAAKACRAAVENGAKAVALCDDSGVCMPRQMGELAEAIDFCPVFVQPSNALDMAAACAVEAIQAGARGVCTAMDADFLRPDRLAQLLRAQGAALNVECELDITAISASLSDAAAAEAEAQPMAALDDGSSLTDIASAVAALGYELSDEDVGKVYQEFRRVIRKRGSLASAELEAIIATAAMQVPSTFHVASFVVNCGNVLTATANITLEKNGETLAGVSMGDGPIDAAFHAIESIIGHHYELDDFQIGAVTKGREAVGNALVRLRSGGKLYSGNGVSTDIIGASIRAYINALNKIVYEEK